MTPDNINEFSLRSQTRRERNFIDKENILLNTAELKKKKYFFVLFMMM
jgi:hypothetical protein